MASKREIFRSSALVGFFYLLGGVAGIVVETSIAARLGLSKNSDIFYAAYTIPYVISNLLFATSQFSLVPFFGTLDAQHAPEDLWRGFSYAVNIVFLGICGLALLGIAASPLVIRTIAPGFSPEQKESATELARWLFPLIIPAGVTEVFRSLLLSQRRFGLATATGFLCNAIVIVAVIGLYSRLGLYSIVVGYLVGYSATFLSLGIQILISFPVRYTLTLRGSGEAFRKLRGAGTAQLAGAMVWQGSVVVERVIASFLPPGTLTALGYGLKILSALSDLFAGSVGTVALPALSRAVARNDQAEERKLFRDVVEISLMFVIPALVFCGLLNRHIIRMVFERGIFTSEATALLSKVFFYYTLSLLPFAFARLLTFYLFARHEGGAYFRFISFLYGLTLAFDLTYVAAFRWGAKGIPLGLLTASLLATGLAYRRNLAELKKVFDRALGAFALKNLQAGMIAALLVFGLRELLQSPKTGRGEFVYLCGVCGAGVLIFFGALAALRAVSVTKLLGELTRSADS